MPAMTARTTLRMAPPPMRLPVWDHCDRNLFAGDVAELHRFWAGRTVTS